MWAQWPVYSRDQNQSNRSFGQFVHLVKTNPIIVTRSICVNSIPEVQMKIIYLEGSRSATIK